VYLNLRYSLIMCGCFLRLLFSICVIIWVLSLFDLICHWIYSREVLVQYSFIFDTLWCCHCNPNHVFLCFQDLAFFDLDLMRLWYFAFWKFRCLIHLCNSLVVIWCCKVGISILVSLFLWFTVWISHFHLPLTYRCICY